MYVYSKINLARNPWHQQLVDNCVKKFISFAEENRKTATTFDQNIAQLNICTILYGDKR